MPELAPELLARFTLELLDACRRWNVAPLDAASVRAYAGALLPGYTLDEIARAITLHESDAKAGWRMPSAVDLRRILSAARLRSGKPSSEHLRLAKPLDSLKPDDLPAGYGAAYAASWRDLRRTEGYLASRFQSAPESTLGAFDAILDEMARKRLAVG